MKTLAHGILILMGCLSVTAPAASGFSLSDLTFWVGQGTNEAALVIDWHDVATPDALAWGYRWNGVATGKDMLETVAAADDRLRIFYHPGYPGAALYGMAYDAGDDGGRIEVGTPGYSSEHGVALDSDDRYREGWFVNGYWSFWSGNGNPYAGGAWSYEGSSGFATRALTNGDWQGWAFDEDFSSNFGGTDDVPRASAAAASPYAAYVIGYVEGSGVGPDWVSGDPMTNAAAALGRPTVDTTGDGDDIPLGNPVPVVPVGPAFRHFEIVTIGQGGELVLAFDHPVTDDPMNPYGIDFLVFGNALQNIASGGSWTNGNPSNTVVTGVANAEGGTVSVSQDGTNWVAFTNGPHADEFAPTLGRVFDPSNPDPALGAWNLWWGPPTDPRFPLDPGLIPADFDGMTVADMSRYYRRSAGGTPFDIAALPLAADPATGRKWFQYIRIEQDGFSAPEIDAVSDVAPARGYEGWQLDHFTFWQLADDGVAHEATDAEGDGWTNLLEYVTGRDPWTPETVPLFAAGTAQESNTAYFVVSYDRREALIDTVALLERTTDYVSWTTNDVNQAFSISPATGGLVRVEAGLPAADTMGAVRWRAYRP